MKRISKVTAATMVGLGMLALAAVPVVAGPGPGTAASGYQLAHMGGGPGYGPGYGMGYGMGPGMMGHGYGMMGPGYGMMGPGPGGAYGVPPCLGAVEPVDQDLGPDDVRARLERHLAWRGNERLRVGEVAVIDDDTITAAIETVDGSLVEKLRVDRHSGWMQRVN